ncbi:hypothetical protein [Scytonema hofmannii]|uniref:hypothetical protein n=1 Tax=Scytonema hofmannii TaxID=34078 RepID=UPI0011DF6B9E|nr:hypothetical protein [Scytonema hofmannii]
MFTELFIAWLWKGRIPVAIAFSFRHKLIMYRRRSYPGGSDTDRLTVMATRETRYLKDTGFLRCVLIRTVLQVVVSTWKDWQSIAAYYLKNLVSSQIQVWE